MLGIFTEQADKVFIAIMVKLFLPVQSVPMQMGMVYILIPAVLQKPLILMHSVD